MYYLTITILWANSTDAKLVSFFLFFPENIGNNFHEMLSPVFWEK